MSNVRVFLFLKTMEIHAASVHEKKNPFKCENCDYSCCQKGILKKTYQFMRRTVFSKQHKMSVIGRESKPGLSCGKKPW